MRNLDHQLYAWLIEPDEQRFLCAFNQYFAVAFPAIVRYLARLSRWDRTECEDLAQEALLRFFDKAGKGRWLSATAIRQAVAQLVPLQLGAFHVRQTQRWRDQVAEFTDASLEFRPPAQAVAETLKASLADLAGRIRPLQRQGWHLVNGIGMALRWEWPEAATEVEPANGAEADAIPYAETSPPIPDAALEWRADELLRELSASSERASAAQARVTGIAPYCRNVRCITQRLPALRVPSNSYLFEIALSIYLDECKGRGRRKRGGDGRSSHKSREATEHPLLAADGGIEADDVEQLSALANDGPAVREPSVDPTAGYEHEELLRKFEAYLREPLIEAVQRLEQASTPARAAVERRRVEAVSAKLSRTVVVLSALGEGYSQEQVAARLGITRNQVKYIVESVQEAYLRFDPEAASYTDAVTAGELRHV